MVMIKHFKVRFMSHPSVGALSPCPISPQFAINTSGGSGLAPIPLLEPTPILPQFATNTSGGPGLVQLEVGQSVRGGGLGLGGR